MVLDCLSQNLDPNPETVGCVVNFFTPYNLPIANIVCFLRMIFFSTLVQIVDLPMETNFKVVRRSC